MSERRFQARYSQLFTCQLDELAGRTYDRVATAIGTLERFPYLGAEYSPEYEASLPPVSCRQMYVQRTTKVLYYTVNEDAGTVDIFFMDDARTDPHDRFSELYG